MNSLGCTVDVVKIAPGLHAVRQANALLEVTVLPDKGADIHALIHRPSGVDFLWKSPQGLRRLNQGLLSADSAAAWLEVYAGGWQEILPNGGDACHYKGVELNFHGESTMLPWQYRVVEQSASRVAVEFSVKLYRSPFTIRRVITLEADSPCLRIAEEVSNWGSEPIDFMWGHHPALGSPFLSGQARLFTNAQTVLADDSYDPPHNPFKPGTRAAWPNLITKQGLPYDLSVLPAETERRDSLAYLMDFDGPPWYAVTNPELNIGLGFAWSSDVFKCLWLWQEVHATRGFPWYGEAYTVAVEPWSSYPGFGLAKVMETTQTQLTLEPKASIHSTLCVTVFDLPAPHAEVTQVDLMGRVQFSPT